MTAAAATLSVSWRVQTTPSKRVIWRTPPALYIGLDREFAFTLDVAADDGNAVCDRYFTTATDALGQSWAGEVVFCNPPYGRELERWVEKAFTEASEYGATVVMLLPARTGNRWFHRWCLPHAEVRFIRGRINFTLGGAGRSRAPFDSMVVIFRPYALGQGHIVSQPVLPGFGRG